ncbi:MAG: hypothetical protein A3I29_04060 [Candidatus Magasanikbacteria bacterium RIFCSPLOWO2_02_FULL_44_11]|uniref:Methyltransferase n=1 Tax=Candidatus Magasanikbacteria bacterium RIFCSPLOWO2_02_FULL_44_11 TaxID=1798689 RepID=A0A1F6N9Y1_9BACT|nr:MAG: hypothetical protein A3I29_04060 [Candidatus Magasanikbacteria bacterium RIFCSPLOWO2_02_FULL_44_11]
MSERLTATLARRTTCRVCEGKNLKKVLSLGSTPPANAFLRQEDLNKKEESFPLECYFCQQCSFVQLLDIVSPELLFGNYVYVSSTSPVFIAHFEEFAQTICKRFELQKESLIVDVGSNDGILLRPFKKLGMTIQGVDPATKIAEMATANGIETIPAFFNKDVAHTIRSARGPAQIITATSVFPHVDDLNSLVAAIKELLADNGIFIVEAYYLVDMVEKNLFDTAYHEHLSYFTVDTLTTLFNRLGMEVFDVEKTDTHGGSLRVFIQKHGGGRNIQNSVQKFINEEKNKKINKEETFLEYEKTIQKNKEDLLAMLRTLKAQGKKIVGYGAPAKGNTLLNYFGIGTDLLDYIVDDSSWKQGLYSPGKHIPIVSSDVLRQDKPDYILILAWNFARPIMERFLDLNLKFIIPVPRPVIIEDLVDLDLFTIVEGIQGEAPLLEGKKVVITGGSGFIGSYMIAAIDFLNRHYFKKPCEILSLDNHIIGKKNNLLREINSEHIEYINHNVCNAIKIDGPVDYIICAAGVASPVYYKRYPIETIEGTIFGLKNSLEVAREKQVKGILYFSSSEIYGDPDPNFVPTPETYKGNVSSIGPRSCYDESKRLGETFALAYYNVHKVPIKIVRPFNIFGPGMSSKDYRVIPTFLSQGLEGKPLTVHDKGNQTRTFCYATDAVIGFFKVLLAGRDGEVYNIGNANDEINMKALADMVSEDVFNKSVPVSLISYPDNYPQDEPRRRCPDLTKITTDLGYKPVINLKSGLRRSYLWMKNALI